MLDFKGKIEEALQRSIQKGELAGASVLLLKDGKELLYTDAGYANIEKDKPFVRNTICRIYSMTKPITAAAAMLLMERGLLELGQPVGDILDSFKNQTYWHEGEEKPVKRNMLVKDLLCMTSGLSYGGEDPAGQQVWRILEDADARLYGKNPMTTMEFADRIGHCSLSFNPGDGWLYGTGADIIGAVIEKLTGMRYGEFLKKEFFEPLGMEDTGFYVPAEKYERLADVYESTKDGVKLYVTNNLGIKYTQDVPAAFESGGAGLVSTIDDYAKFATMLMQNGRYEGKRILKVKTVEFMTKAKLLPWQQEALWRGWDGMYGYTYGNLLRIMEEPGMAQFNTYRGEYGWDGWLGTYFCNSPENKLTILLFCQRKDSGTMDVTKRIRNIIAANIE